MKIQLKASQTLDNNSAKPPSSANMLDGELAINFNANDPSIFLKDSNDNIVKIAGKNSFGLTNFETAVTASINPPSNPLPGNLYFDLNDESLYYYNGGSSQWVHASKGVDLIPDIVNSNQQSGTLDDRYVNKNGDTSTGNQIFNAGINIVSSDIRLLNGSFVFEGTQSNGLYTNLQAAEPTSNRSVVIPNINGTLITTGDTGTVTSTMIADGTITNNDLNSSADISLSKLASGALPSTITVNSTNISDGSIVDADINTNAAISLSKLGSGTLPSTITIDSASLPNSIDPASLTAGALPTDVTIASANITDNSIVNADISSNAAISVSKLSQGSTNQLLIAGATNVQWASDIDIPGTLDVTGVATFDNSVTISGALSGSSISLTQADITLGNVTTPTDTIANGGGLLLKGNTNKTFKWYSQYGAWTSSENIELDQNKAFRINGNNVLTETTLGSTVINSSLTSVGTITSGTWNGTQINESYIGVLSSANKVLNSATTATSSNTANSIVLRDSSGDFTANNITGSLIGNASTANTLSTARTIQLTGDLSGSASFDGSADVDISVSANFTGTTNLNYDIATREIQSDTGQNATLPVFTSTTAGLTGASGGGTANYLRADGSWAIPQGVGTDLSYTASTSTLESSTGNNVSLPLFSNLVAGLVPSSSGNTDNFLKGDGTWSSVVTTDAENTYTANQIFNDGLEVDGTYIQVFESMGTSNTLDMSTGNYFKRDINSPATIITFTNPPTNTKVGSFTLELNITSGSVSWPSSVNWAGGSVPILYSGTNIFVFVTTNGGTSYYGAAINNF